MKTGFDERIREIYDSGEFEYNPHNWTLLERKLNPKKESKKTWGLLGLLSIVSFKQISAAASVLFAVGFSVNYFNDTKHLISATHAPTDKHTKAVLLNQDCNTIETYKHANNSLSNSTRKNLSISLNKGFSKISNTIFNFHVDHPLAYANNELNKKNTLQYQNESIISSTPDELDVNANKQEAHDFKLNEKLEDEQISFRSNFQHPYINSFAENDDKSNDGLSFIGSIGKGTNNTNYSAGLSYQAGITKRFFFDGAVTLHSSYIQEVTMFNNTAAAETPLFKAMPNNSIPIDNDRKSDNNINVIVQNASYAHLALNPSLGVKINKRFSAKAGLDVQKRISNTKELGYVESNSGYHQLPNYDFGFTPKLGVRVNDHWQTNFVYRKGINNLVSSKNYFNRDYFQLQIGYKF